MPPALKAALWMLGTLTSLALMAIAGRELSAELSTLQILFFRSAIGLLIILAVIAKAGRRHLRTAQPAMQILRNVAHYMGQFGWFYGISLLPLAQVFALEFTMPIWATLLAPLLLKETITPKRALVVVIGFVGILIVVRPGLVPINAAALGVLMAAVGYAFAYTLTKKLTRTDTALAIVFYMCLVQLPLGLVPSLFDWVTPSAAMWPWVLAVSVTGLSAHYCLARAFAEADAVVVVPMEFLRLPLIAVAGLAFYGETLDPWVLGGAAVICAGNFLNVWTESRRRAP